MFCPSPLAQVNLPTWRKKVDDGLAKLAIARARCREERTALRALDEREEALEQATKLTQAVASHMQSQAHKQIASIVTKCLAIFREPYTFRIVFDRKRGKTEARLLFLRDGLEVDPVECGGVLQVGAFALRVAALVLTQPPMRRILLLDEPFSQVSEGYRHRIKSLIKSLSRELGIQFIVVTHDRSLKMGTVVDLGEVI